MIRDALVDAVFPWWAFLPLALGIVYVALAVYSLARDLQRDAERRRRNLRHRPSVEGVSGDVSGVSVSSPGTGQLLMGDASVELAPSSTPPPAAGVKGGSARATGLDTPLLGGVSGPAHPVLRRGVLMEPRVCVQQVDPVVRRRYREARQEAEAAAVLYPSSGVVLPLGAVGNAPAAGTGRGAH